MSVERVIKNVEEMQVFAQEVAQEVRGGEVIGLSGPLGAGKTTFVQGLAKALGVRERVTSPSYTVVGEYAIPHHSALTRLVHVDLYRLSEEGALRDPAVLGVLENANQADQVTVIEWVERLGDIQLPHSRWIRFEYGATEGERKVTFL